MQASEPLTFIVPFPSPTSKRWASAKNSKQEATAAKLTTQYNINPKINHNSNSNCFMAVIQLNQYTIVL